MREASEVGQMSSATADVLFGGAVTLNDFDRDMYEMQKTVSAIFDSLEKSAEYADERYGVCRRLRVTKFVPPVRPKIEFTLGLPVWADL
jgi:hypothetical protein